MEFVIFIYFITYEFFLIMKIIEINNSNFIFLFFITFINLYYLAIFFNLNFY